MRDITPLTMKDIARELGISVATVSRALKDSPRISAERREIIQRYAREHHFTPNVLAESLRHSRVQPQKIIGVIIPELVHYYFASILKGIEEEATAHGYQIIVAQSGEHYEREVKLCRMFLSTRCVASSYRRQRIHNSMSTSNNSLMLVCPSYSMTVFALALTPVVWW